MFLKALLALLQLLKIELEDFAFDQSSFAAFFIVGKIGERRGSKPEKMFLVVGLGNFLLPSTRHNIGMMAVDWMIKNWQVPLKNDGKLGSLVGLANISTMDNTNTTPVKEMNLQNSSGTVAFLKPKGFMNLSGVPVAKAMKHYRIPISRLLVIHDDLDRKLGKVSVKNGGSSGGHNGLKSIIQCLGSSDFARIRVGIDRPDDRSQVSSYVLSSFTNQEFQTIDSEVMVLVSKLVTTLVN